MRYWVTYIGIDITGMGSSVAQLVRQFFPNVVTFSYSPEVKTRLVLKAYDVIHKGRLEFDAGWTDMAQSLMAIRKTSPPAVGNSPTPQGATTKPAMPTWLGRYSTHCRTNRLKGRPPSIPGSWRFIDEQTSRQVPATVGTDPTRCRGPVAALHWRTHGNLHLW
jgi:hypothetical protein